LLGSRFCALCGLKNNPDTKAQGIATGDKQNQSTEKGKKGFEKYSIERVRSINRNQ
jgi:hypothetical protein